MAITHHVVGTLCKLKTAGLFLDYGKHCLLHSSSFVGWYCQDWSCLSQVDACQSSSFSEAVVSRVKKGQLLWCISARTNVTSLDCLSKGLWMAVLQMALRGITLMVGSAFTPKLRGARYFEMQERNHVVLFWLYITFPNCTKFIAYLYVHWIGYLS